MILYIHGICVCIVDMLAAEPLHAATQEPRNSKITFSLENCGRVPFPKDDLHELLLDAVQQTTAELVAANAEIATFELSRGEAEQKYGKGIYSGKDEASEDKLSLAWIPGAVLLRLQPGWALCSRTGTCGKIQFVRGLEAGSTKKPETMILSKGKKKQLSIRFSVEIDAPGAQGLHGSAPSAAAVREIDSGKVGVQVRGIDFDVEALAAEKAAQNGSAKENGSAEEKPPDDEEMYVGVERVSGKIDYDKLVLQFGSTRISPKLLQRLERLTVGKGKVPSLHRWLRRNIFFSHRDLEAICKCCEEGKPFYLYTGRGPSSAAMHLGHLIPFMMTKWLQDAFDVPLVIQMTDDEKFLWKGQYDVETGDDLMRFKGLTMENAKDIIACGFKKEKTFIFSDLDYVGHMYPNIIRIWKAVTYNTAKSAFGFDGSSNIGQSAFPAIQAAPSFPSSFKVPLKGDKHMACLIPCAIDQDPYFRITRDVAHKLVPKDHPLNGKPALLHSKFFPPLQGAKGKMSASDENSAVYLTDPPDVIESKIMKYAFSGGRATAAEQRKLGADLEEDVSYQWLRFFLEDDEELERIGQEYGTGQGDYWNTGAVKKRLIALLQDIVAAHQVARAKVDDEEVSSWMRVRELEF
mmetsp:Transcript_18649/g.32187  ORF Transcript_18649/g.32187 Transcript_18649/m.32187 type:complete len:633 (-) Transcript_18649:17-1915(-)